MELYSILAGMVLGGGGVLLSHLYVQHKAPKPVSESETALGKELEDGAILFNLFGDENAPASVQPQWLEPTSEKPEPDIMENPLIVPKRNALISMAERENPVNYPATELAKANATAMASAFATELKPEPRAAKPKKAKKHRCAWCKKWNARSEPWKDGKRYCTQCTAAKEMMK